MKFEVAETANGARMFHFPALIKSLHCRVAPHFPHIEVSRNCTAGRRNAHRPGNEMSTECKLLSAISSNWFRRGGGDASLLMSLVRDWIEAGQYYSLFFPRVARKLIHFVYNGWKSCFKRKYLLATQRVYITKALKHKYHKMHSVTVKTDTIFLH
jgi:hypothetical protein